MSNSKMKIVYNISERNGRSFWNKIGVAFTNNDGSLNVRLESFPVSGEMQIREYIPKEDDLETTKNPRFLNHEVALA